MMSNVLQNMTKWRITIRKYALPHSTKHILQNSVLHLKANYLFSFAWTWNSSVQAYSPTAPPAKSKTPNKTRRQTGKNIHKIKMEAMRCLLNLLLYFLCAFNFLFLSRELSKPREKRATAAAAVSTGLLCFWYGFRITFSLRGARSALSSCVACFFRRRSMQQQASNDFYTSRHFYRFSLMLFTFL